VTAVSARIRSNESLGDMGRRLPRARRLGDIEAAARRTFCRRGYAAASIAEIAAEAGIAEGTIYKFFESKQHLLAQVIRSWYESMLAVFESRLGSIHGARARIRFIIWQHLTFLRKDVDIARLCIDEAVNAGANFHNELRLLNRRYTRVLVDACRDGVARGELRSDIPIPLIRDMIFGGLYHHCAAMLQGRGSVDPDKSADMIVDFVFAGIRVADPPAAPREATALERIERAADRLEALAAQTGESARTVAAAK
jgi:AcrR family transcriptional regulator